MNSNYFHHRFPLLDSLICTPGNNWEYDEVQVKQLSDDYKELIENRKNILPQGHAYLNSRLHDSWVESAEQNENGITILLKDFQSHCFSDAICDEHKENVPHKKRVFPIGLHFSEIQSYSISRINKNNKIIPLSRKRYLSKFSEFLFDEALLIEPGNIDIGILFLSDCHAFSNKSTLLLHIRSKNLNFTNNQREAFQKMFPEKYHYLFDAFWKKRIEGKPFDYSESIKFIKENRTNG